MTAKDKFTAPAKPTAREADKALDDALADSFPASDPPAASAPTVPGKPAANDRGPQRKTGSR